jgi:hypothetical protein
MDIRGLYSKGGMIGLHTQADKYMNKIINLTCIRREDRL